SSAIWSVVDRAFWRSEEWRPALSNSVRRLHHEDFTGAAGDAVEEAGRAFVPVDSLTLGLHAQGLDVVQHAAALGEGDDVEFGAVVAAEVEAAVGAPSAAGNAHRRDPLQDGGGEGPAFGAPPLIVETD